MPLSGVRKRWRVAAQDAQSAMHLARELAISPVTAQLLVNRGLQSPLIAREFLRSPMGGLHAPRLVPGVTEAAEKLLAAVRDGKRICIYGDYDVDGTTGTAILMRLLTILNAKAEFYVPNRITEGYGLNRDALKQLHADGVQWIISVDCGISAVSEVAEATALGLKVIITDHHEFAPTLPAAEVLVHPRLPGSQYPETANLCGAGVAFKLAWATAQLASGSEKVAPEFREFLLDSLALAALGTVADVMPLTDENRVFVKHGLDRTNKRPLPGIKALCEAAGLKPEVQVKAEDIGYKIGPRLNAAGRLECARLVVELLTTSNPVKSREIAEYLEDLNSRRQTVERKITAEAKEMVESRGQADEPALVVASAEWHQGVVGIVASRLVDHFGKPSLVIAQRDGDELGAGSGRSIGGLPLHEALAACSEHLISFGGHAAAAGFKVRPEKIDDLRKAFVEYVRTHFHGSPPQPMLAIEAEVPLMSLTFGLLEDLEKLEPYGTGNLKPRFLAAGLKIDGTPRRIGQGERHLSFTIAQDGMKVRAVAFGFGERLDELMSSNGECSLVFVPKINEWNGRRTVEMEVIDFQPGAVPTIV